MEQVTETKERFTVTDASSAEWVMGKLAEKQAEIAEMGRQRDKMLARYNEWYEEGVAALTGDVAYFEKLLSDWARDELATGKAKSIALPSGRVGFRASALKVTFAGAPVDKASAAFVAMAKQVAPEYIEVKENVRWADFKKSLTFAESGEVVTENGEVLPDMKWEAQEPKFYADVKGGA